MEAAHLWLGPSVAISWCYAHGWTDHPHRLVSGFSPSFQDHLSAYICRFGYNIATSQHRSKTSPRELMSNLKLLWPVWLDLLVFVVLFKFFQWKTPVLVDNDSIRELDTRGKNDCISLFLDLVNHVVNQVTLKLSVVAMAATSPEKNQPLLQLQEVDSSRGGSHVLPPILSSCSPSLSLETSQPICIPSPYTDLSHEFTTIPFYSPSIFSYTAPSFSDCPSVHQSLSPSLFWPSHGHVGPPIPLHCSQARPQHSQSFQSPWMELTPRDSVLTTR